MHQEEPRQTSGRKKDHVELCVSGDVTYRTRTTGLELYELEHNALPELNLADVDTSVQFLGKICSMPVIVSSMTGGYAEAESINSGLGEVCQSLGIAMGLGSMRQAIADATYHDSFRAARRAAPSVPLYGNIGAAEIAGTGNVDTIRRLADLIEADGFAVHLNPLQELMQAEGEATFGGVLRGIGALVRGLDIPVIVKEVGAGLSAGVVARLLNEGVRVVDVAGAGGTSWAGVELLRRSAAGIANGTADDSLHDDQAFWDWGIPTARAIAQSRDICGGAGAVLIGSGGISTARDACVAIALGAHIVGAARPVLKTLIDGGQAALADTLNRWRDHIRKTMFLTGSHTVADLRNATLTEVHPARIIPNT